MLQPHNIAIVIRSYSSPYTIDHTLHFCLHPMTTSTKFVYRKGRLKWPSSALIRRFINIHQPVVSSLVLPPPTHCRLVLA